MALTLFPLSLSLSLVARFGVKSPSVPSEQLDYTFRTPSEATFSRFVLANQVVPSVRPSYIHTYMHSNEPGDLDRTFITYVCAVVSKKLRLSTWACMRAREQVTNELCPRFSHPASYVLTMGNDFWFQLLQLSMPCCTAPMPSRPPPARPMFVNGEQGAPGHKMRRLCPSIAC